MLPNEKLFSFLLVAPLYLKKMIVGSNLPMLRSRDSFNPCCSFSNVYSLFVLPCLLLFHNIAFLPLIAARSVKVPA